MQKSFYYISLFMGSLFVIMGCVVQIVPPPMMKEPSYAKHMFGIALLLYGGFRLFRAYRGIQRFKRPYDE